MRPRYSIAGPLILIALGVLFLLHTFSPDFRIGPFIAAYWPYLLIIWGVIQLVEIAYVALRSPTIPPAGVGFGSWFVVLLICVAGAAVHAVENPNAWWDQSWFNSDFTFLGSEHDFSIPPVERVVGTAPHIVIENFRGDAKVSVSPGPNLTVSGHKSIRAFDNATASRGDVETPVEVLLQGQTVVIRCNQNRAGRHGSISTNLDISVPPGASLEATGTSGDFDVSGLAGDVDINSGHADVRVENIKGNLHIDVGRSREVRCESIGGGITVRGHGSDISLANVAGEVDVNGDYGGLISLAHLAKNVRVASMRTEFDAAGVPGEVKLARGSLDGNGVAGPTKVVARATDISLVEFTESLDLSVDKGDVELRPGHLPLSNMSVHDGAGLLDIALPAASGFTLTADTDRGSISDDFGLAQQSDGHHAHLEGSLGKGAELTLSTRRGDINIHRANGPAKATPQIAQTNKSGNEE